MIFKNATIDVRFSRESGTDPSGRYLHGQTYTARRVQEIYPGSPVALIPSGRDIAILEIRPDGINGIDAEVFFNGQFVYSFAIDGTVDLQYTVVRYFHDGFWFILEYRFLNRFNS
jgi:hypothetical protein